jgi:hypothetical protein
MKYIVSFIYLCHHICLNGTQQKSPSRQLHVNQMRRAPMLTRERPSGKFPHILGEVSAAARHPLINPLGLYDFVTFADISVIKGSGEPGQAWLALHYIRKRI